MALTVILIIMFAFGSFCGWAINYYWIKEQIKPCYSIDEIKCLVDESETRWEVFEICELITLDKQRYSLHEWIEIQKIINGRIDEFNRI